MSIWLALLVILLTFYVMSEIVDMHFIKSLDNIARWLKLPQSVAGATLLALGTSAPEISTAMVALFLDGANPATGIGSIVGSAIFQILVVIGFAAVVRTSYLNWRPITRDSLFYALSILLLILFVRDNVFTLWEGIGFVSAYFVYLFVMFLWARYVNEEEAEPIPEPEPEEKRELQGRRYLFRKIMGTIVWPVRRLLQLIPDVEKNEKWTIPVFVLSLAIIGYSCFWLVIAAEDLAGHMGIAPAIIALTILAGGSSIPEMVSSAIVARQGRGDMAIANAIGSNVFDILMSLGLPVLIYTAMHGDLEGIGGANIISSIVLLFATLIAVVLLIALQRFKVTPIFGSVLIVLYVVYVWAAYSGWLDKLEFSL